MPTGSDGATIAVSAPSSASRRVRVVDVVAVRDQVARLGLDAERPAADHAAHVGCSPPPGEGGDQRLGPEVLVDVDPHAHTNTILSTNLMENNLADGLLGAAVAFLLAVVTTPVGVSGAVLLLPFQASVLKVATPALTPTNLLYNVVTTPGALVRLAQENRLRSPLVGRLLAGALPGHRGGRGGARRVPAGARRALRDRRRRAAAARRLAAAARSGRGPPSSFGPLALGAARLRGGRGRRALRHRRRLAARAGPRGRRLHGHGGRAGGARVHRRYVDGRRGSCSRCCRWATSRTSRRSGGSAPRWESGVRPAPTSGSGSSTGCRRCSCAGCSGLLAAGIGCSYAVALL